MALYSVRGLIFDAFKWTGGPDQEEDPVWLVDMLKDGRAVIHESGTPNCYMMIGKFKASLGDYIFLNTKLGQGYPCTAHFFERVAEPLPAEHGSIAA